MRKQFVAGNWKMNTLRAEAMELARGVVETTRDVRCDIAICVPFPHLADVGKVVESSHVGLGAQDVHWEAKGAFTGEVSVPMLRDYCRYVIIGHSERRQFFGETNETVRRRLVAALEGGLDPIVCIGEVLEERRSGNTEEVLARQLREGFKEITWSDRITVAYEPVWAIGTGETATPEVAQSTCAFIRGELAKLAGDGVAQRIRIQYGGSVNADNAAVLLSQPDIDGALVGGASLKADQFAAICAASK
ncbi:MAG: triose-phosphate isomerase [Dehalococcoidia bacterium]|nr:triose-phosphate isomerase [Dehalococcoidia bacterium]